VLVRWLTAAYALIGSLSLLTLFQVARFRYLSDAIAARRPLESDALARWLAPRGAREGLVSMDGMLSALLDTLERLELAVVVSAVPAGVLTYHFLFRARAEAVRLGGAPRYASHWIVTGFAVPVLNLVRPLQVMADLWRASLPSARASGTPLLVRLWWEALLVANALALAAGWRLAHQPETAPGLLAGAALARLALLSLAVILVRGLAERLESRSAARNRRPLPLDRSPQHAGVDLVFLAALAVAVGAGVTLGGGAVGGGPTGVGGGLDDGRERRESATPRAPELRERGEDAGALVRIAGDAPSYPRAAREAGLEGTVLLELTISERGEVVEVAVVQGLPLGLTEAAFAAAATWRFRPVELEGRPSRVTRIAPVVFRLAP
jgi:TonB family protein